VRSLHGAPVELASEPPGSRPRILGHYGEVDPHTVARARFRALSYGIIHLDDGHEIADATGAQAGRTALAFALDQ
jgi:hypothetical protein